MVLKPILKRDYVFILALILIGITSGLLGSVVALFLHFIQHIAYGYSLHQVISKESFLEGVTAAPPIHRLFVMIFCGFIAGLGWWSLYHFGKPLVSIQEAIKTKNTKMPIIETIANVFLQMASIALGSPLGREVAPREISALFASWLSQKLNLDLNKSHILIACAAGAGFTAVYNIPLGGALFTIEVLLKKFNSRIVLSAMITSVIAVVISWIWLGNHQIYPMESSPINASLVCWAIVTGPLFGLAAYYFTKIVNQAKSSVLKDKRLILLCILNFTVIGFMSMYFPVLLGNGMSPTRIVFFTPVTAAFCTVILILRVLIVWSSFRVGAMGGILFPSIANGALLAIILATGWSHIWPHSPSSHYAIVGATAFVAASQQMPITAIILMMEFTNINYDFLIPMIFCVVGSVATYKWCEKK